MGERIRCLCPYILYGPPRAKMVLVALSNIGDSDIFAATQSRYKNTMEALTVPRPYF